MGLDGCRSGWIAVVLHDHHDPEAHYLETVRDLDHVAPGASAVAIDIPIGFPTGGPRQADVLARQFLGPRRSSVFLTPVREAIEAGNHASATRQAVALTGRGISRQAYALGKKILEVEGWLLPSSTCPVYEVHPEVSFAVLLGRPARASKKTWAGMVERRQGLERAGISLDHIAGEAISRAAVDDVLDAAVAAWSAGRLARGTALSFPDPPPVGASGRPVAIWA